MLELPITIRVPRLDEIASNNKQTLAQLDLLSSARIVEGYLLKTAPKDQLFKFYSEININNSRLWDFLFSLLNQLPDDVSFIYGLYNDDPKVSSYLNKHQIFLELKRFRNELAQDCSLEYGVLFQSEEKILEIFVTESKYVKFWGTNEVSFRQLMNDFLLPEVPDLNFRDEFPKVVEPLINFDKNAIETYRIIEELDKLFL